MVFNQPGLNAKAVIGAYNDVAGNQMNYTTTNQMTDAREYNVSSVNVHGGEFSNVGRDYNRNIYNVHNTTVYRNPESPLSKFLELLPSIDCESKHIAVRSAVRTQQTAGQWLLTHEIYTAWKAGQLSTRLLWLNGIPGAGKTVLCSRVIDDLRKSQGQVAVLFFYCEHDVPTASNPTNVFASLLHQILLSAPPDSPTLSQIFQRHRLTQDINNLPLTDLILELSKSYEKTFVVIDGLDECGNLEDMLPEVITLAEDLYILISSRDHTDIRAEFRDYEQIRISIDDIVDDVRGFAKIEIRRIKIQNKKLRDSMADTLVTGSQGSFLWSSCQVQRLRGAKTDNEVEQILATTPPGMASAIVKSLRTIDPRQNSELLRSVLHLVVCALRPITLRAFAECVGTLEMKDTWDPALIPTDQRALVDQFTGLLICVSATGKIRYRSNWPLGLSPDCLADEDDIVVPFHQCIKEFLLAQPTMLPSALQKYSLHPASSIHDSIARLCLVYQNLVLKHVNHLNLNPAEYPFAEYALREWLPHSQAAGMNVGDFQKRVTTQAKRQSRPPISKTRGLCKPKTAMKSNKGLSPLHTAMKNSEPMEIIDSILKDANVNQVSQDHHAATALHFAVMYHQEPMVAVERLLAAGADVHATTRGGSTALHILLEWQSAERALPCLALLLQRGVNPNVRDAKSRTPLHALARRAQPSDFLEPIVDLLIEHNADINPCDDDGKTPLHWAAHSGCEPLVTLLLANGATVNAVDIQFRTPLSLASQFADITPHQFVIEQLYSYGADESMELQRIDTSKRYYIQNRETSRVWRFYNHQNGEGYVTCSQLFSRSAAYFQWKLARGGEDQIVVIETHHATAGGFCTVSNRLEAIHEDLGGFHFIPVRGVANCYYIATGSTYDDLQVATDWKEERKGPMAPTAIAWGDPYQMWQLLEVDGTGAKPEIPGVAIDVDPAISKFGALMVKRHWLGCPSPPVDARYLVKNKVTGRSLTTSPWTPWHVKINDTGCAWLLRRDTTSRNAVHFTVQIVSAHVGSVGTFYLAKYLQLDTDGNTALSVYLFPASGIANCYFIVVDTQYDPPLAIADAGDSKDGKPSLAVLSLDDPRQMWQILEMKEAVFLDYSHI